MSKSAPKAPDYRGAAAEQAESSREVTNMQTWANRPDQVTPFGTQTWAPSATVDPATGQDVTKWTQTTNLTPEAQAALDSQMRITRGRSGLAESMLTRAQGEYGDEMDWSKMPAAGQSIGGAEDYTSNAENALYSKWAGRALPEFERQEGDLRTRLYNQGLREGDEAFVREADKFGERRDDAMENAAYEAAIRGGAEAQRMQGMDQSSSAYQNQLRQQGIAEEMQRRGFSLNEINAILTGQQVGMPAMPNFTNAQAAQPVQALQAANLTGQANLDAFNAEQQALQGMMSGIGGMAGGFMGFSDRRLKKDIHLVGKYKDINIYRWRYLWGELASGVMADEVEHIPGAVVIDPKTGYKMVDYGVVLNG